MEYILLKSNIGGSTVDLIIHSYDTKKRMALSGYAVYNFLMFNIWIINLVLIVISTAIFGYVRYHNKYTLLRIIQPMTTLLIIVLASLGSFKFGDHHLYTMIILLALSFSLAGDCYLIEIQDNIKFLTSVLFYWLGITIYSVAITYATGFSKLTIILFVILTLGTLFTVRFKFWEGLKKTKLLVPILIYSVCWGYLLSHALTILQSDTPLLTQPQKILIMIGISLYFLGDINLSFHKFNEKVSKKPYWLGGVLYASGQTLIAISASLFVFV